MLKFLVIDELIEPVVRVPEPLVDVALDMEVPEVPEEDVKLDETVLTFSDVHPSGDSQTVSVVKRLLLLSLEALSDTFDVDDGKSLVKS